MFYQRYIVIVLTSMGLYPWTSCRCDGNKFECNENKSFCFVVFSRLFISFIWDWFCRFLIVLLLYSRFYHSNWWSFTRHVFENWWTVFFSCFNKLLRRNQNTIIFVVYAFQAFTDAAVHKVSAPHWIIEQWHHLNLKILMKIHIYTYPSHPSTCATSSRASLFNFLFTKSHIPRQINVLENWCLYIYLVIGF